VIGPDDVLPCLADACPSITAHLRAENELDAELLYITAAAVARMMLARLEQNDPEVEGGFVFIERLHTEGDEYVRELATIGFLESLWTPDDPAVMAAVERRLGAESRRWRKGLLAFWSGDAPLVLAVDD